MNLLASIRAAIEEMLANRSRSLLAMFSIVVGVWSVTVIVAAGDIGRQALVDSLEQTLGRPATVTINVDTTSPLLTVGELRSRLTKLMGRYSISESSPLETASIPVDLAGTRTSIAFKGVSPALAHVQLIRLQSGRWLTSADAGSLAPMVVINAAAAAVLVGNPSGGMVGASLRLETLSPVTARVVGVVASLSQEAPMIYAAAPVLERFGPPAGSKLAFSFVVRIDPTQSDRLAALLKFDLARWGLSDGVTVQRTDQTENVSGGLLALQLVLAGIAGVSLVSGGLGVLNLGLVSARERAHEFGIRRAFGATRVSIFTLVLAQAFVTTMLAGVVGVALAAVAVLFLPGTLSSLVNGAPISASFPIDAAAIGIALAAFVGLLSGVIPARRATHADVVQAIRS